MRTRPPANLVSLLARLKLATTEQVAAAARHVGRLAGDLPDFESVWVDALVQARRITPFQAAEINSGRGEALLHGPYVIAHALPGPHWADCYAACHVETRKRVRLYVVRRAQRPAAETVAALAKLIAQSTPPDDLAGSVVEDFGTSGSCVWAACGAVEAIAAADWMVENGRFPAAAVLHVARAMSQRLADLEPREIVHGDLCAAGLLLQESGQIVLPAAGLRGIVRPHEGYSFNDLLPEAYDYLAPERIAEGKEPAIASDVYACGALWWHLLTGRPPFPGGNSLAKLKAVDVARVVDVRQLAPDVPESLAAAIGCCLARQPDARPPSFAQLVERLGAPTRAGSALLSGAVGQPAPPWRTARLSHRRRRRVNRKAPWTAGVAAVVVVLLVALSPIVLRPRPEIAHTAPSDRDPSQPVASLSEEPSPAPAPAKAHVDPAVKPAAATLPVADALVDDIVLPADGILPVEQLDLKPHVRVRGRAGKRPMVRVPRRGLLVDCEDVTFEGIDFVWDEASNSKRGGPIYAGTMIVLAAQTAAFRGCSFSAGGDLPPVAITTAGTTDGLPGVGSALTFRDCVLAGVAAVVDCQAPGGLTLTMHNGLCLAAGPLVRLHKAPSAGEPVTLTLDHVTTRGESPVLECRYGRRDDASGRITITANDSVLASSPTSGLLIFSGAGRPERLLASLTWTGQGSIVTPETPMLVWRSPGRPQQSLAEEDLQVAGLVRSQLEFAAGPDGPPAASRVTRWQVPLRSADPPGAAAESLATPQTLRGR